MTPEMEQKIHKYWDEDKHNKIVQMIMKVPEEERDIDMLGQLVVAYNNLERYEDAVALSMELKEESKEIIAWYYRIGYALVELEEYEKAAEYLTMGMELVEKQNNTNLLYELKDLYGECVPHLKAEKRKMGEKEAFAYETDFDYEGFEAHLLEMVEAYAKSQLDKKEDLYIMSLEYFPEYTTFVAIRANTHSYLEEQVEDEEDYSYYKFCEEEWDLYGDLKEASYALQARYNQMEEMYGDAFEKYQEEHATKIIEICKTVMKRFKETDIYKKFPELYLNVYVREYFSDEECIRTFCDLNGEDKREEYSDWL